ncbi:MAG: glutamine synthetase family protein [Candidatus Diapherotrites archaeon]|nr:glutamine synthetase family protein [Candidatus Diapherotrites archaeon]
MESNLVLERVKKDNVKFVQLQFTDLFGAMKEVTLPVQHLPESLEKGTWFDGSSIEGFARIHESDMYLKPDESTYAVLPFNNGNAKVARLICDIFKHNGKHLESDPRYILKNAIEEAKKEGFVYNAGPELEFFLFKKENGRITSLPHDIAGYFDLSTVDLASDIRKDITIALEAFGINVEMAHHEVAAGQHEIDFKYSEALTTADKALTLKFVVKSIAQAHGVYATFMPKPVFGINGSGMHVHQSLFDDKGKTLFYDSGSKYNLSKTALSFIAGQLKHARSFSAITAPTVNSYKRLVPGYEAPVYVCWGQTNRSALIRVPHYSIGREQATRAELRCPDPSCNPYLAFAVMLKAGLDGIKKCLLPPEPVEEDVYEFSSEELEKRGIATLPASLNDAVLEFKKSQLMEEVLGEEAFKKYARAKTLEWNDYKIQVTGWEKKRYFESL